VLTILYSVSYLFYSVFREKRGNMKRFNVGGDPLTNAKKIDQVSISSTLYVRINSYKRRFSSYVLALLKNLYEKCARTMLMKLTTEEETTNKSQKRRDNKNAKSQIWPQQENKQLQLWDVLTFAFYIFFLQKHFFVQLF
jgi:hypothetical protein